MSITILCVLIFVGLFNVPQMLADFPDSGRSFRYTIIGYAGLTAVAAIGVMFMRRWGVILYALVSVGGQLVLIKFGYWNPISMLLSLLITAVFAAYFRRMR